jgi:hypothetical protein
MVSMPRRLLLFATLFSFTLTLQAGPVFYAISYKAPEASAVGIFGSINPATGVVTQIGPSTPNYGHDLDVSPSGQVYAIFGDSLYTIDKDTGVVSSAIGILPTGVHSIAFRSDGALFGVTTTDLYSIDPATAAGTHIGAVGLIPELDNIRFDNFDNLYTMTAEPDSLLYVLNQTSAVPTLIGASGTDDISLGAFFGGMFLGTNVTDVPRIVSVNPTTGLATLGAATDPNYIYLFSLDPTSVPEPGTVGLLGAGLVALIAGARRISRTAPSDEYRD